MSILNSISSFFDDLTTSRRHAAKKRPIRSSSPTHLPFYTNGHQQQSTNSLPSSRPGLSLQVPPRQASWDAPTPSLRSTSTTPLRTTSSAFNPPEPRKLATGIQLQELSPNGVQPPPPVSESWARIDAWAESNYPELYDQLSYPATSQDVDDLEAELECSLPLDVRESLYVHDGQDRGGKPTGILFGVTLLDCEEIVEEWQLWKRVAQAYAVETLTSPDTPSTSASTTSTGRRQSKIFGATGRFQNCRPPETIQKVYAHPCWIPLAKDFTGNNIAVDLAPGPRGTWGQVILFGRECETKYVVARSWSSFLAAIADDFEAGEARFDTDDTFRESFRGAELRIRPCQGSRDDTLIEVLKGRVRLREREIRKKRETQLQQKRTEKESPVVDLMVNSPRMTDENRFPSPSLPREGESPITKGESPVIGTPIVGTPGTAVRRESVTVSGRDILAKEEANKPKGNKIVSGGVVVDGLASPILVKKSNSTPVVDGAIIEGGVIVEEPLVEEPLVEEDLGKATGLGIEDGGVVEGS